MPRQLNEILKFRQGSKPLFRIIIISLCFGLNPFLINCFAQESLFDPLEDSSTKEIQSFGTIGGGYGSGPYIALGYTHIVNHFGVTVSFREMWYPANDLPSDYTGFYTNNNITTVMLMVGLGGRPDGLDNIWLGAELGPAYVNHRKEVETLNPDYGEPWGWVILPNLDKYLRDNIISNTIGLSCRVKCEFAFSDHVGMEFALFGNFNVHKIYGGLEWSLLFGKLK